MHLIVVVEIINDAIKQSQLNQSMNQPMHACTMHIIIGHCTTNTTNADSNTYNISDKSCAIGPRNKQSLPTNKQF